MINIISSKLLIGRIKGKFRYFLHLFVFFLASILRLFAGLCHSKTGNLHSEKKLLLKLKNNYQRKSFGNKNGEKNTSSIMLISGKWKTCEYSSLSMHSDEFSKQALTYGVEK